MCGYIPKRAVMWVLLLGIEKKLVNRGHVYSQKMYGMYRLGNNNFNVYFTGNKNKN